jgi:phosphatidate cytidylyltransferase
MSGLNRETFIRILSAIVALPVLAYALITNNFLSIPILVASILISLISLYEYYMISDGGEAGRAFVKTGLFFGFLLNLIMYFYAFGKPFGFSRFFGDFDARVIIAFFVVFVAVILVQQLFTRPLKGGISALAVTVFGVMYIVLSISHIILLKSMKDGIYYILILIVVVMLNDTGAYFGGVLFGKHKAGLEASPNKSWEGYFSGLLFSIIGFILANQVCVSFFSRELFTMIECTILGIILSVLANVGDLVESAVKRDGGFKDSGSIIPGHGGMWDVFDATMFSLPFFYYYLVLKGIP